MLIDLQGNDSLVARSARLALGVALLSSLCLYSAEAISRDDQGINAAPAAEDTTLHDVVVTATREGRASQRVPIALTAISGDQLAESAVTSAMDLTRVAPSLYVLGTVSPGSPRYTIRGLTGTDTLPSGSAAVATYIDDVYQASQFGILSAIYDVQRVEVLRGPQGTTFGKNTTGGAVAYFSQTPTDEAEGYVSGRVAGGDQSQRFIQGAVNVPLIEGKLAMRISGDFEGKGSIVPDLALGRGRGGLDSQSGRFQLRWTPSSDTTANLYVFATRLRSDPSLERADLSAFGVPFERDSVRHSNRDMHDNFDNYGATLRIEQSIGTFNLTSVTHYRWTIIDNSHDLDALGEDFDLGGGFVIPGDFFFYRSRAKATQYGQELRLATNSSAKISGIVGAYFEKDRVYDVNSESSVLPGPPLDYNNLASIDTKTETHALFGNLTFHISEAFSVIGGVRKTWETKTVDGSKLYYQDGNYDWTDAGILTPAPIAPTQALVYDLRQKAEPLTWDITANFNPDSSFLLFGRVARGFRSGGFNPAASVFPAALFGFVPQTIPNMFLGETVKSYEVGVKTALFGNRLRANATAFHYDYGNQQVTVYQGGLLTTANAASAKVNGAELELTAFIHPRLDLSASISYTDAKYEDYVDPFNPSGVNYSGNRLLQSAKWNANFNLGYAIPVSDRYNLRPSTSWTYRSRIYFDSANSATFSAEPMALGNVRLSFEPADRALASGFAFFPANVKYFDVGRAYGIDLGFRW